MTGCDGLEQRQGSLAEAGAGRERRPGRASKEGFEIRFQRNTEEFFPPSLSTWRSSAPEGNEKALVLKTGVKKQRDTSPIGPITDSVPCTS